MPDDTPTSTRAPAPPKALGAAGRDLWKKLHDGLEWDPHEVPMVQQVCRQADLVAELEQAVAADGITTLGSAGQPRLNGAVTELRMSRLALARLLGQLQIPNDAELTPAQLRGRRAAEVRWSKSRGPRAASQ